MTRQRSIWQALERFRQSKVLHPIIDFVGCLYLAIWNWMLCYFPSYLVRRLTLSVFYGVKMGANVNIHMGVKFLKPWGVSLGNNVNIQMLSFIDGRGGVNIGNNVDITLGVKILSQQHDLQDSYYTTVSRPVTILDNCVVGSFSIILPGAVICEGAVIGAGSVVAGEISSWVIAVGNPCAAKKARSPTIRYTVGYKRYFH